MLLFPAQTGSNLDWKIGAIVCHLVRRTARTYHGMTPWEQLPWG